MAQACAYLCRHRLKFGSFGEFGENKTGFSFFVVKATALKQQISKFYQHIISIEASNH